MLNFLNFGKLRVYHRLWSTALLTANNDHRNVECGFDTLIWISRHFTQKIRAIERWKVLRKTFALAEIVLFQQFAEIL